jgi:hypothetical protein
MLDWVQQEQEICARIEGTPAILKILLKTKDDPFFLAQWIDHHLGIVGPGISLFLTTDPQILRYLRSMIILLEWSSRYYFLDTIIAFITQIESRRYTPPFRGPLSFSYF